VVCDVVCMCFSVYELGTRLDSHAARNDSDYSVISVITRIFPYRVAILRGISRIVL